MGLLGEGGAIDDAARERGPPACTRSSPAPAARSHDWVVVTWWLCVSRERRGRRDLSSWSKTLMLMHGSATMSCAQHTHK